MSLPQRYVFFSTNTIKLFAGEEMFGTGDWTFASPPISIVYYGGYPKLDPEGGYQYLENFFRSRLG